MRKELGGELNSFITTIPKRGYRFSHGEPPFIQEHAQEAQLPPENVSQNRLLKSKYSGAYILLTVVMLGLVFYWSSNAFNGHSPQNNIVTTQSAKLSVAVLPFQTKTNRPEQVNWCT